MVYPIYYIKMVAGYGVYEIMMIPIVCKCIYYGKDKIVAYRLSQKIKVGVAVI